MNIDRWLYPRPKTQWSLSEHSGEIIWIPVYSSPSPPSHRQHKRIVDLHTLHSREIDEGAGLFGQYSQQGERQSQTSLPELTTSINGNTSIMNTVQAERINELSSLYRQNLGILDSPHAGIGGHPTSPLPSPTRLSSLLAQGGVLGQGGAVEDDWLGVSRVVSYRIPCLYLQQNQFQRQILLYFHSNAEDIHLSAPLCKHLMQQLNVCVLAMEYPGYSYYQGQETSEDLINENAERVFDFLTEELGIDPGRVHAHPGDIFVLGRSIGCSPAIDLVTRRHAGMLIIVSPFLSIEQLLKDHYGMVGSLGYMVVKNGYDNINKVGDIASPTLIIHGKRDELIGPHHSIAIFGKENRLMQRDWPERQNLCSQTR